MSRRCKIFFRMFLTKLAVIVLYRSRRAVISFVDGMHHSPIRQTFELEKFITNH